MKPSTRRPQQGAPNRWAEPESFEANRSGAVVPVLSRTERRSAYRAQPVRRVTLPKPDMEVERRWQIRPFGTRVWQQALRPCLEPDLRGEFHPSSYGYRPGRSAHQAISKAQLFIRPLYSVHWVWI